MAGYNYMNRGGYTDDRNSTTYMGRGAYSDERNSSSYGENDNSDHVCRPVIVDSEGRKRPIVAYGSPNTSSESYVTTRTERIVEHVRAPVAVTGYNKFSPQAKVEPLKEYGVTNDKWPNPSNQVYDGPEYGHGSQSRLEPARNYGVTNNWRSSPLNASQDRPQKVEDFVTNVQTEVSRPTRVPLLSSNHWRTTPGSTGQSYGATNGYGGEYTNNNSKNQLSGPINEIGKAVEMLKDGAKPSSIATAALQSWSPVAASTIAPKRESYDGSIDSREAARRYGNRVRPIQTGENYTGTLDSREAARRYGGATV